MHKSIDLPSPPAFAGLAAGRPLALFLDFDGTLVEIADIPDGIHVPDGVPAQLAALHRALGGRIAIVSGRAIADIQSHLGPLHLLMVGSHGAEIGEAAEDTKPLSDASRAELAALTAAWPRLLVETKPHGIAVHYRQEPEAAPAVFTVMDDMAAREGLAARRGKMVVELGPKSANKGAAVARLMAAAPFAGALPIFIGDDTTDEDGFAAVAALGGYGILVGAPRPTAAHYRLADPEAVHRWLTL